MLEFGHFIVQDILGSRYNESELSQVADELRREMVDAVSVTGGHLGAGLGVVRPLFRGVRLMSLHDAIQEPMAAIMGWSCSS